MIKSGFFEKEPNVVETERGGGFFERRAEEPQNPNLTGYKPKKQ